MAADVINNFRNQTVPQPEPAVDDCKSAMTDETRSMDSFADTPAENKAKGGVRKKGVMGRIRKRLSVIT